jgi:hypothetical protein
VDDVVENVKVTICSGTGECERVHTYTDLRTDTCFESASRFPMAFAE